MAGQRPLFHLIMRLPGRAAGAIASLGPGAGGGLLSLRFCERGEGGTVPVAEKERAVASRHVDIFHTSIHPLQRSPLPCPVGVAEKEGGGI